MLIFEYFEKCTLAMYLAPFSHVWTRRWFMLYVTRVTTYNYIHILLLCCFTVQFIFCVSLLVHWYFTGSSFWHCFQWWWCDIIINVRLLILYNNLPDRISLIINSSREYCIRRVCWLRRSFMTLIIISRKLQVKFQWNLSHMFSICVKCDILEFKVKTVVLKIFKSCNSSTSVRYEGYTKCVYKKYMTIRSNLTKFCHEI